MRAKHNARGSKRNVAKQPQRVRTETPEEEKVRMFYKDGTSTMLFCRMPLLQCRMLEATILRFMERKHTKLTGKFIFTK